MVRAQLDRTGDEASKAALLRDIEELSTDAKFDVLFGDYEKTLVEQARESLDSLAEMLANEEVEFLTLALLKVSLRCGERIYVATTEAACASVYDYTARRILHLLEGAATGRKDLRAVYRNLENARVDLFSPAVEGRRVQRFRAAFNTVLTMLEPRYEPDQSDRVVSPDTQRLDRRVFISHASEDRSRAESLVATLESGGVPCWFAPREVPIADPFDIAIVKAIRESEGTILLLSRHSNISPNVSQEISISGQYFRPVITVRLEDVQPSTSLEFYVGGFRWVDCFGDSRTCDRNIQRLTASLLHGFPARELISANHSPSGKKIFAIHAAQDRSLVYSVVNVLERAGLPCWVAPRDIPIGNHYYGEICAAIDTADCILVFLTRHSNSSRSVENEIERAVIREKRIVPLRLDDIEAQSLHLGGKRSVDLFTAGTESEHSLQLLIDDLKSSAVADRPRAISRAHKLFVSFAPADRLNTEKLVETLERHEVRCWIAPRDIPFGINSGLAIAEAIRATRATLLLLPSQGDCPSSMLREVETALAAGKRLVPVRFSEREPCPELIHYVRRIQWADLFNVKAGSEENEHRLIETLRQICIPSETAS
jgi:hypothetical protein